MPAASIAEHTVADPAAGDTASFAEVQRRLELYFLALWGAEPNLRVLSSGAPENAAGRRVSIAGGFIGMPISFVPVGGQPALTQFRAAIAHAAAHLAYSTVKFAGRELRPLQVALISLIEDTRVESLAMREMPGLRRLWSPFHVASPNTGSTAGCLMTLLARALIDPDFHNDHPFVVKGRTLFGEATAEVDDQAVSRTIGLLLSSELAQMRIPFDARTYLVEPAYRDDNLGLWDFADAGPSAAENRLTQHVVSPMNELGAESADIEVRKGATPSGEGGMKLDGDAREAALGDELPIKAYSYDEWDYLLHMQRRQWCTLLEKPAQRGDMRLIDDILQRNEDTVSRLANLIQSIQMRRPQRLKRQFEGDRLDLDACIGAAVDLRSGRAPDPRVHQRLGRSTRDLSVLLLLDLSQSTNDYVPGAGTTVLNLTREATVLLADALDRMGDDYAIHGFDSNGRMEIEYYRFKDFDGDYDAEARARIAGMRGQLSTRMGAALRHAGHLLNMHHGGRKLVLLLTDGEPHDIDVQDRRHLLFDTKHAIEELARQRIVTFCISLDPAADDYVERIFGARNYLVLDRLERLPQKLPLLYMRLTR